jgi:hypothetical protein
MIVTTASRIWDENQVHPGSKDCHRSEVEVDTPSRADRREPCYRTKSYDGDLLGTGNGNELSKVWDSQMAHAIQPPNSYDQVWKESSLNESQEGCRRTRDAPCEEKRRSSSREEMARDFDSWDDHDEPEKVIKKC